MKATYKDIPKPLRQHYKKEVYKQLSQAVKAFFVFRRLYKNRAELFAMGKVEENLNLDSKHDYWLTDSSEHLDGDPNKPLDFVSCWYGDKAYRERVGFDYENSSELKKFWRSFLWVVIRNSVWNLKTKNGIKFAAGFTVEEILVKIGMAGVTTWRNKEIHGEQSCILKLNGTDELYFRYSYTVPLSKWSPLRLLGYKWTNVMRGVESRYLWKSRRFK